MTFFISIAALVAMFAIATTRPINMGLLGFGAAFIVGGWISGISIDEIESYFPGDLFVIVVGLTLLFGIARANGSVEVILESALKLVRGKPWAIVWLMFFLSAALMALGSPMAVAMLAPIAMPLAKRHSIDPLLMGMMISHGALGTAFSPITVYAVGVDEIVSKQGIDVPPLILFVVPFVLNLLFAAAIFAVRGRNLFGTGAASQGQMVAKKDSPYTSGGKPADGHSLPRGGTSPATATTLVKKPVITEPDSKTRATFEHWLTFAAIGALVVTAVLGLDVGVAALCLSVGLLLVNPRRAEAGMKGISWPATLLVCGVVTYMGVLTANGTLDRVGEMTTTIPWPLLSALILLLVVGVISAVGSSIGTILIAIPLAMPLLEAGALGAVGFIVALGFAATVVDVSPFSTNGIIVLASAEVDDRRRFQRRMLGYCAYIVLAAPLLAWAVIVLPTSM